MSDCHYSLTFFVFEGDDAGVISASFPLINSFNFLPARHTVSLHADFKQVKKIALNLSGFVCNILA